MKRIHTRSRNDSPPENEGPVTASWFRDVRLDEWEEQGGDRVLMGEALARIEQSRAHRAYATWVDSVVERGPGHWIDEWSAIGRDALMAARSARDRGDSETARDVLMQASLYFTIAAYPNHRDSPAERVAYDFANRLYLQAGQLTNLRIELLEIAFEGARLRAFVHLPPSQEPSPVILTSGGIDVAKTTHFTLFRDHLARAGFAMISLDNAGFGDSSPWPASRPDMDRLFSAVIDRIEVEPRLDATRIGALGASYGGNTVARLAFTDTRVKAVVSAGGPIHAALDEGRMLIERLPVMTRAALARCCGVSCRDSARLGEIVRAASLANQGLLGMGQTKTPILAINNGDDPLAPLTDMFRLADSSTAGAVAVTHGSGHCPPLDERYPAATRWFETHLQGGWS